MIFTRHDLRCDARVPWGDVGGTRACDRKYEPPEGAPRAQTPASLRRLAAKEGWTRVPSPAGRQFDRDMCPEHKPEPAHPRPAAPPEGTPDGP